MVKEFTAKNGDLLVAVNGMKCAQCALFPGTESERQAECKKAWLASGECEGIGWRLKATYKPSETTFVPTKNYSRHIQEGDPCVKHEYYVLCKTCGEPKWKHGLNGSKSKDHCPGTLTPVK